MTNSSHSRHLIDPELLPTLEMLPSFSLTNENLGEIREAMSAFSAQMPAPSIQPVEKIANGKDGPVSVLWFDPAPGANDRPALLHVHGGGMILGAARDMTQGPANLASSLGIPVASVEYRLAPEAPFPAPQEDCYAALEWLAISATSLGVDPQRIGVIGESAGGGLAAAVAQMARDRDGPSLAAQLLVYPMLDYRVGTDQDPWQNRHTGEFSWNRELNRFGWSALRGDYAVDDARKGWFSPSLAEDLSGLPPAWIGVGALDLFLDEDLDYARRLIDAGVNAELHLYPGAYHGFDMAKDARVAQNFARDLLSAASRLLAIGSATLSN